MGLIFFSSTLLLLYGVHVMPYSHFPFLPGLLVRGKGWLAPPSNHRHRGRPGWPPTFG